MKQRTVKILQFAHEMDMGGMPVRQPLPTNKVQQVDPFLLLHHFTAVIPERSNAASLGVGPHPHRGFSPVTFLFQGDIHHRDSRGNTQIVKAGGVQWMDSGMGMMHSERPSKELAEKGGIQEGIQLWINTPHSHKLDQPNYQALQKADMPQLTLDNNTGTVAVIAGDYETLHGPANSKLNLLLLRGDFNAGANHAFAIPPSYHLMVYLLRGTLQVEHYGKVEALNLIIFNNDGAGIELSTDEETQFLLMAGEPINEKVESYGPFVMTSQTEIMQALRDYQMGKMGVLIEEFE